MTKTQLIFSYLLENDYIENTKAYESFGATRLGSIVYNLKQDGVDIHCTLMTGTDRNGNESRWGRYRIVDKTGAREIYRRLYEKRTA